MDDRLRRRFHCVGCTLRRDYNFQISRTPRYVHRDSVSMAMQRNINASICQGQIADPDVAN